MMGMCSAERGRCPTEQRCCRGEGCSQSVVGEQPGYTRRSTRLLTTKSSLTESSLEDYWLAKYSWPPRAWAYLPKLWGKAVRLITDFRTTQGGGRHSVHHPIQWTNAETKGRVEGERQGCALPYGDRYKGVCGDSKPAPNAVLNTRETDKENLVMRM